MCNIRFVHAVEARGVVIRDALEDTPHTLTKLVHIMAKLISWELKHKAIKVENISYAQKLDQGWN